jgi:hypothetical protein
LDRNWSSQTSENQPSCEEIGCNKLMLLKYFLKRIAIKLRKSQVNRLHENGVDAEKCPCNMSVDAGSFGKSGKCDG